MIIIARNHLKAASYCMAKTGEIRYYLQSVCVQFGPLGRATIASTDGAHIFVGLLAAESGGTPGTEVIIPSETVLEACRSKAKYFSLIKAGDQWTLGAIEFAPIDHTYPNWRQIVKPVQQSGLSGEHAEYAPRLLYNAERALNAWDANNDHRAYMMRSNGDRMGVMQTSDAFVGIMPRRWDKSEIPSGPLFPWLDASVETEKAVAA
jgi:hypothetical protein